MRDLEGSPAHSAAETASMPQKLTVVQLRPKTTRATLKPVKAATTSYSQISKLIDKTHAQGAKATDRRDESCELLGFPTVLHQKDSFEDSMNPRI